VKNLSILIVIVIGFTCLIKAQNPVWLNYTNGDHNKAMVREGYDIWIGTNGGLVKFDNSTGIPTFYNRSNTGLPCNNVTALALDANGTKWIGTSEGLVSFDGNNWTVYNTFNSGLPYPEIAAIAIDSSGTKWIGCWEVPAGGRPHGCLVAYKDTTWTSYNLYPGFWGRDEWVIAIDHNNIKWIGTNYGLASLEDTTWTIYSEANSDLPDNMIREITVDRNNIKWIGTWAGGLAAFDDTQWSVYDNTNSGLPVNNVSSIVEDFNGKKWIGTIGGGLVTFDSIYWIVYNTMNSGLPYNNVTSLVVNENGEKWIGCREEFYRLEEINGTTVIFDDQGWSQINTSNSGLPGNEISEIAIGSNGTMWIGTTYNGLAAYDGTNWTTYNTSNSGLPDNRITTIAVEDNGKIWIGSGFLHIGPSREGFGLTSFDGVNWITYTTSNSFLPDNFISAIDIDTFGTKWICTFDGLAAFDDTSWWIYNEDNSDLPSNTVISIAIDGLGAKWIGTNCGLATFAGNNWTVYNTSNSDLLDDRIFTIDLENNGTKWIGTGIYWEVGSIFGSGLTSFDGANWSVFDTTNSALPDNNIWEIAIDDNGTKWICTEGGGLASFDGYNWSVFNTINSGLPDNNIRTIAIDDYRTNWIGTSGGLAAYNENGIPVNLREFAKPQGNVLIYPNPCSGTTRLRYQINDKRYLISDLYSISGQKIRRLLNEVKMPGEYEIEVDLSEVPAGVYVVRLQVGDWIETEKLLVY